jgi:hypothetical protein
MGAFLPNSSLGIFLGYRDETEQLIDQLRILACRRWRNAGMG